MDYDPDIALPSVEAREKPIPNTVHLPYAQSDGSLNVPAEASHRGSSITNNGPKVTASPTRTPLKTGPATISASPGYSPISRSPSSASLRHDRSITPKLDRKRSVPNFSTRSSTPSHQPQFRRASSILNPAAPVRAKLMERPQMTSTSVAKDYFERDLVAQARLATETVVLHSDACYGHRFSRPKATKAMLGSIVERPERIHAALLGASTAYVRLGDRHKDGKNRPQPDAELAVPPFMFKRTVRSVPLTHPAVTAVHGNKWMEGLQLMCDTAEAKLAMGQKELARPIGHTKDSRGNTLPALHSGDLYLAPESLAALQGCLGGVCDAVDLVFQDDHPAKRAFVCIRPPGHHCSAEMPSGFCWVNNVHVGITYAAMNHGLTHAAIVDFDLHHGDGSQMIAWDHNRDAYSTQNPKHTPAHKKTPIGYYSLHDINSYPCEYGDEDKVRNASTCLHTAHGQSIWNVHLEEWTNLDHFFHLYESRYKILLDKAASFLAHHSKALRQVGVQPKAAIFLSSGFDASQWEGEGMQRHKVNVPTEFYARITADIVKLSEQADLGVNGRVISVLEGGYSDRALTSGVLSHLCGLASSQPQERPERDHDGPGTMVMDERAAEIPAFDPAWWHVSQLELLEAIGAGHMPPPSHKLKEGTPSSYLSPTHASTARMTDVAKERRSISAQIEAQMALENAPAEPVPEVDWITAAYELSRLLIPDYRQTQSYTHEELNAEHSRARRDRQSLAGIPNPDPVDDFKRMQLRDRKVKPITTATQLRVASRSSNRRTTIAAASDLPDPAAREAPRTRRRSSAASSVLSGFGDLKIEGRAASQTRSLPPIPISATPSDQSATVPIKKIRAPVRKPVSSASSPRKARSNGAKQTESDPADKGVEQPHVPNSNGTIPQGDGIEDLTSGMKKISIKLKMPTEEQHNAKQRKVGETAVPTSRASRKAPVPRAPRTKGAANNNATSNPSPSLLVTTSGQPAPMIAVKADGNVPASYLTNLPVHPPKVQRSVSQTSATTMSAIDFLSSTEVRDEGLSAGNTPGEEAGYVDDITAQEQSSEISDVPIAYPKIMLTRESSSLPST